MVNIKIIFGFLVFIPLLVSSYKDEYYDPFRGFFAGNIKRIVPTSEYLFGTDTKIYYIRNENNEVKYTIGNRSIQDIVYDAERYSGREILTPGNPKLDVSLSGNKESESGTSAIVYPEILVIVDYDLYKRFNKSKNLIILYLVSYWNSVDLRFSELLSPMFQLHISAIIIAEDSTVLTYLQYNKHLQEDAVNIVLTIDALVQKGRWLFNLTQDIISLCDYDIAITMTSNKLCNEVNNGDCIVPTLGITRPSKVCSDDFVAQRTEKIAIVQNEGAYDKINFVARQIGLLLGSKYVGDSHCTEDDGSLSSRRYASVNSSHWSRCSERNFRILSESSGGRCLRRLKTFKGISLASYFPGSVMDANQQCRTLGWRKACQIDESICRQLKCTNSKVNNDKADECTTVHSEAPDGTPCGDDKICMLSTCEYF